MEPLLGDPEALDPKLDIIEHITAPCSMIASITLFWGKRLKERTAVEEEECGEILIVRAAQMRLIS